MTTRENAIGIFDSGFGGLTVFKSILEQLPAYDYMYLGDNARSPYGDHSFETVYEYTWQSVRWLFDQGCSLVILACNTASAKALRSIQQLDLPNTYPNKRVLGVIRPTAEVIGSYTQTKHVGILGTKGTIRSNSYALEIQHFFPEIQVYQQSCPLFVPMIENGDHEGDGIDFFIDQYLKELQSKSDKIDCILLACTHYPLLIPKISEHLDQEIKLLSQGHIVADSLVDYLRRHTSIESTLKKTGQQRFFTTGDPTVFDQQGSLFLGQSVKSTAIHLP